MREIEVGRVDAFPIARLPVAISLEGKKCFLVHDGQQFLVFSSVCPHKGGEVADAGSCFECPQHGWQFDRATGQGLNAKARLATYATIEREGRLFVQMGPAQSDTARRQAVRPPKFTLSLHAHACFEVSLPGFSLITDPWLEGPAFMGAWTQYPPPLVRVNDLSPSAILITHEHSDHFHEPTLAGFPRDTAIYAPDFPNQRILKRLAGMGFSRVTPLEFGETVEVGPSVQVTAYEPAGVWNDAIFLIDVDGFRILNLNDAGLNQNIPPKVGSVDLIAAQFSVGASGYPWTWDNVPLDQKVAIMERARLGRIQMLEQAVNLYGGRYLLPFASHFALWHPSHRQFMELLPKVSFDDVRTALAGKATVLDLLPGSKWDARTSRTSHQLSESDWFDRQRLLDYAARAYEPRELDREFADTPELAREDLAEYLMRLNEVPEIAFCEDLQVLIEAMDESGDKPVVSVAFEVAGSRLRMLQECPEPNLTMTVPARALAKIVHHDVSWDELHIGYWGSYHRQPDVYTPGFWRLLQAPYFQRSLGGADSRQSRADAVGQASVVASLIESHGDQVVRILRRYGLYCAGCHRSTYESLQTAARQHGLDQAQTETLVRELQQVCS
jgi:CMP-N-acetylneuraminate monooxygenase